MDERSFDRLVDHARSGDAAAQSNVLERLEPVVRGFFVRRVGTTGDVDDLVQNTLVRVLRSFGDLKESRSIRAFALKAALYELHDLYRGRYRAREARLDPDLAEGADPPKPEGLSIDIERALSRLTPRARTILELKAMGYRYEEIASMIESTEAAVKMQVKRAFEKLRSFLGPAAGFPLAWLLLFLLDHRL